MTPESSFRYKRLSGTRTVFFSADTLWIGKDHLLSVKCRAFTERYKRFYFSDIQSVIIYRTEQSKVHLLLLFFLSLFTASLGMYADSMTFLMIFGSFIALRTLVVLFQGPTCACYIQTAVQQEKLISLNRLRPTRKALKRLLPFIETAQGTLSHDDPALRHPGKIPLRISPVDQSWHEMLFMMNIVTGAALLTDLFFRHVPVFLFLIFTLAGSAAFALIAMTRRAPLIHFHIKTAVWISAVCIFMNLLLIAELIYLAVIRHPKPYFTQWQILDYISSVSPLNSTEMSWFYGICICLSVFFGCCGLILIKKYSRNTSDFSVNTGAPYGSP